MKVFVSHIMEEAELAALLKARIDEDFLGKIECYVSSDTESILAGENWLNSVEDALKSALVEVILCSPASVKKPWINFEAGAGWMRGIPIVPVCHSGLTPSDLPMPMSVLQSISASEPDGLLRLYATIANAHKSRVPRVPFDALVAKILEFERAYKERMPPNWIAEQGRDQLILARMIEALNDPTYRFRSVERLSFQGGISESETIDLLRREPEVMFAKGKSGKLIARLKSR
jgi:hypothetical protein